MSESSLKELFDQLHKHLTQDLLRRIMSGEATASELNVARQLLKDNHIDSSGAEDPHLAALARAAAASAPHLDDDDVRTGLPH